MNYVFGPVYSRRLGMSLGVDPIPMKTCNWNCVYCQLGRTVPLTNQRKDYFPPWEILDEVRQALLARTCEKIDWITIAGSGEPLLCQSLGRLIREIKKSTAIPVALITNGSLLYLPEVRREALAADAVLPSLDAGSPEIYRKINRAHPDIPFEKFIQGLIEFRKEFKGRFWPEVMLVQGVNDSPEALQGIADILNQLEPDMVYLNVPVRPAAEQGVRVMDKKSLSRALSIIGRVAKISRTVSPHARHFKVTLQEILDMICRHPLSQADLQDLLKDFPWAERRKVMADMRKNKTVKIVERNGRKFWCSSKAVFSKCLDKKIIS